MRDALRETWQRCVAVLQGRRRDVDFDDELQTHLQLATDDLVAGGVDGEKRAAEPPWPSADSTPRAKDIVMLAGCRCSRAPGPTSGMGSDD